MVQEALVQENQEQGAGCRHHWIIEPPHGATSWGQCKVCGARKEFPNSAGDALWERDASSPLSSRWGSVGHREPSLPRTGWADPHDGDEGF